MSTIIFLFIAFLAGGIVSYFLVKNTIERRLVAAKNSAKQIIERANEEAKRIVKEGELKAKEKWHEERNRIEKGISRIKRELERKEKELKNQEFQIDKKADLLVKKDEELKMREKELNLREKALKPKEQRLEELVREQIQKLQELAGMTREEAKSLLLKSLETEARIEGAQIAHRIREEAKARAEKEAQKIITMAMQRIASQIASESCVTVLNLNSDEMKGRIIGREGRNIRALEQATGVEIIVDDTPESVILSSFDPFKRDIARITIERLLQDGRIHPARIEEIAVKVKEEAHEYIKILGEETILELGLRGMHPELLRRIGKMKYRSSFGQNLLLHSKEVAYLAGIMAGELELDVELAKRASILHDIGKVAEQEYEGSHALVGAQIAKRYGESDIVCNAIAAHHEEVDALSPYAYLVSASDAISGARPGARRENIEAYIKRIEQLEGIANSFQGVEKAYALQAGREIRVIVEAGKMNDAQSDELARLIAKEIEGKIQFPGQIKVTVIREYRVVQYAK